jgi:hypothetical protein
MRNVLQIALLVSAAGVSGILSGFGASPVMATPIESVLITVDENGIGSIEVLGKISPLGGHPPGGSRAWRARQRPDLWPGYAEPGRGRRFAAGGPGRPSPGCGALQPV